MNRDPSFLESVLILAAMVAVAYGAAVLILSLEKHAAPQVRSGTHSSSPDPAQPAVAALSMPLQYDAVVCQDKCRFYARSR